MTTDLFDYHIRPRAFKKSDDLTFQAIFKEWNALICRYCAYESHKDTPYWYNERATMSTFSGAIWKSGKLVLEEFSCTKHHDIEKKRGRVDLWFECGTGNYICEVKQNWTSINNSITTVMKDAIEDTTKVIKTFSQSTPLALTFWVPSFLAQENIEAGLLAFTATLRTAVKSEEIDFHCLVAPSGVRNAVGINKRLYPCVALVGKVLHAEA